MRDEGSRSRVWGSGFKVVDSSGPAWMRVLLLIVVTVLAHDTSELLSTLLPLQVLLMSLALPLPLRCSQSFWPAKHSFSILSSSSSSS